MSQKIFGDWLNKRSIRSGRVEFLLNVFFLQTWTTMAALLIRRQLVDKIGFFPCDLKAHGDTEWSLRLCLASDLAFVPERLTTFRYYEGQATTQVFAPSLAALDDYSLARVIDDAGTSIPKQWQERPGWRAKILETRHRVYEHALHGLDLYRWILKEDPKRFMNGLRRAWDQAPGFLMRQAMRGFPVRDLMTQEQFEDARPLYELLDFLGEKFQPIEVSSWNAPAIDLATQ